MNLYVLENKEEMRCILLTLFIDDRKKQFVQIFIKKKQLTTRRSILGSFVLQSKVRQLRERPIRDLRET